MGSLRSTTTGCEHGMRKKAWTEGTSVARAAAERATNEFASIIEGNERIGRNEGRCARGATLVQESKRRGET